MFRAGCAIRMPAFSIWKRINYRLLAMLLAVGVFFCLPVYANNEDEGLPADMSNVAPIDDLIARVQTKYKGSILNIKLENEDGPSPWRYEVKMLSSEGHVMKLEYDAQSLDLLNVKGKELDDDSDEEESKQSYWKRLIHKFD